MLQKYLPNICKGICHINKYNIVNSIKFILLLIKY